MVGWGYLRVGGTAKSRVGGAIKKIAVSGPATQDQGLVFEHSGCVLGHPVPEVLWIQWEGF